MRTEEKLQHNVKREWKHLCFWVLECNCGKSVFATSKKELDYKWKAHQKNQLY